MEVRGGARVGVGEGEERGRKAESDGKGRSTRTSSIFTAALFTCVSPFSSGFPAALSHM